MFSEDCLTGQRAFADWSPDEAIVSAQRLNLITAQEIAALFAPRPAESNKGSSAMCWSSEDRSAKRAQRQWRGSPHCAWARAFNRGDPKSVVPTVAGFHPEIMTEPLAETDAGTIAKKALGKVSELAKRQDRVGYRAGNLAQSRNFRIRANAGARPRRPYCPDADGLNAFRRFL